MCQVVELQAQWAPRGTLKCLGRAGLGISQPTPSALPVLLWPGLFLGSVAQCVAWTGSKAACLPCLCQASSPETKDKAGKQPNPPCSPRISLSFFSASMLALPSLLNPTRHLLPEITFLHPNFLSLCLPHSIVANNL